MVYGPTNSGKTFTM